MIERTLISGDLEIPRIVTGLWQVADMERGGKALDPLSSAAAMADYAKAGFDAFDMADHYGSSEAITGHLLGQGSAIKAFTKWCPEPGAMTADVVRAGVERACTRMQTRSIDLMQFHWWTFEHPGYLDALTELAALRTEGLIKHIGLTNFDTAHLRLLLSHGLPIATNQVCVSLLDRRATGPMAQLCAARGVKLLAYGTLGGGFLSERWLNKPAPVEVGDWSKMKYRRFIDSVGGWAALQGVLNAAHAIAQKHGVSIANVATRWVLDQRAVAAVIVGARLGESEHRADNARVFSFKLDHDDLALLETAFAATKAIPGDCGDEYRKPPFLTASGDLSHHLSSFTPIYKKQLVHGHTDRWSVDSGSLWEPIAGYSRAVRDGAHVSVSGTTATHRSGGAVAPGDAGAQTTWILDKIAASLSALGARIEDVIRTRIYLRDVNEWEAVSREHGRVFGHIRPANTLVQAGALIGDNYRVEIEAEAIVR